jgi:hypothetical protein
VTNDYREVESTGPFPNLRKELEQHKKDIESFPFYSKKSMFPLWEVPMGPGENGFVNAPLPLLQLKWLGILRKR